jgi:hypothetical protein
MLKGSIMMHAYPSASGPFAHLSEEEKKKRLDAMVRLWQSETEQRIKRDGYQALSAAMGLDEYRYCVWLRFPEWERSVVLGQVMAVRGPQAITSEPPILLSSNWRHDTLLKMLPDWKVQLPNETVFNITVRITPGGLGEGSKWAIVMPRELIPRYKAGWPTQQEWVSWTRSFDWLSLAVGFIRKMLDAR